MTIRRGRLQPDVEKSVHQPLHQKDQLRERGFVNPLCCRDRRNSSDGSRQIGPRQIGPETRYGLALGGQEAASGDDGFREEDQGDDLLQRITHDS